MIRSITLAALFGGYVLSSPGVAQSPSLNGVECWKNRSGVRLCYANATISVPKSDYVYVDSPPCWSAEVEEGRESWARAGAIVSAAAPKAAPVVAAVLAGAEAVRRICSSDTVCAGDFAKVAEEIKLRQSVATCRVLGVMIPEEADFQNLWVMSRDPGGEWTGCGSQNYGPNGPTLGACGNGYAGAEQFDIKGVPAPPNARVKVVTAVFKNWNASTARDARITAVFLPPPGWEP